MHHNADNPPASGPGCGDVVVTVPKGMWSAWLAEGCLPGEDCPPGMLFDFTVGRRPPAQLQPGGRVYVVSHGYLRGYAPLVAVERWDDRRWTLRRAGGAVACTLADPRTGEPMPFPGGGFRGLRWRTWDRGQEIPFPQFATYGVR